MIKKYYCGKCNMRFSKWAKHCPNCGALVSIPLHHQSNISSGHAAYSIWREAAVIIALIGISSYLISMFVLSLIGAGKVTVLSGTRYIDKIDGTIYDEDIKEMVVPKKDMARYNKIRTVYGCSPKHAKDKILVKTGIIHVCDPCGEIVDDQTRMINVMRKDADKYKVRSLSVPECDLCDKKAGASVSVDIKTRNAQLGRSDRIALGMSKQIVKSLWGSPVRRQRVMTPAGVIERVYYGDPVFGISSNNRYVEYDSNGKVILVHEMDGM